MMNAARKSGSLDDLPVLTEVVVPSPAGLKMPEVVPYAFPSPPTIPEEADDIPSQFPSDTPPAAPQKARETRIPQPLKPLAPLPDKIPFPALNQEYPSDDVAYEEDLIMEEPPIATSIAISEVRDTLVDALEKHFAAEIPTLVEAALQNALPAIIQDIQEGLEENAKLALKDLVASLHDKPPSGKR